VQDAEMMEVGYSKAEQNRILYAWDLWALFTYNAETFRRRARIFFYVGMFMNFLLTMMSIIWEVLKTSDDASDLNFGGYLEDFFDRHRKGVKVSLYIFPIVTGFFLTVNSRFNPIGKFTSLQSGAVAIRSEIYMYRCRVGEYMPIKDANLDVAEMIEDLCDKPDPNAAAETLDAVKKRKKLKEATRPKDVSRRVLFSEELERFNQEASGAEIQSDALSAPPDSLGSTIQATLYNSTTVREQAEFQEMSCWQRLCYYCSCGSVLADRKKTRRRSLTLPSKTDPQKEELLQEETAGNRFVWNKAGGDYQANAYMLEDDFLADDGLSVITAEDYMFFRFLPLMQYHTIRSAQLTKRVQILQILQFFLTALLAGSAPLGFERWVPAFVAVVTFITGTLEFENYPAQLRNVNQSLEVLKNLRIWWQSLSMVERRMPSNKEYLVTGTETTADSEISAWKKTLKTSAKKGSSGGADEDHEKEPKEEKQE
jgi:hypothetical protein